MFTAYTVAAKHLAFQCDVCEEWQHLVCETGLSFDSFILKNFSIKVYYLSDVRDLLKVSRLFNYLK